MTFFKAPFKVCRWGGESKVSDHGLRTKAPEQTPCTYLSCSENDKEDDSHISAMVQANHNTVSNLAQ